MSSSSGTTMGSPLGDAPSLRPPLSHRIQTRTLSIGTGPSPVPGEEISTMKASSEAAQPAARSRRTGAICGDLPTITR